VGATIIQRETPAVIIAYPERCKGRQVLAEINSTIAVWRRFGGPQRL